MYKDSIQLITNHYGQLTKNEKIVADYIISYPESVIQMSVQELAQKSGVSSATPVRLAQHMGFDGYKEFRLYLAKHLPQQEDLISDMSQAPDSAAGVVEKVLLSEVDSIRLTLKELDYVQLTAAAERIKAADQLLFFGTGTSYLVCCDAMYKFQRAGKSVRCTSDIAEAAVLLTHLHKNDPVIGISHSGETRDTCNLLKLARELELPTIAATTYPGSTICQYADHLLPTQTRESALHKIAFTSRISQLAAMDALFMAYFTCDYEKCRQNIDGVSRNLQHLQPR